jgi:hypothetical protein
MNARAQFPGERSFARLRWTKKNQLDDISRRFTMTRLGLAIILVALSTVAWLPAQNTEFSYDGRVRSGGVPFDGNGQFKFAIVSSDGTICYWSNDGVTLTGNEPTSSVHISVSAGFFSVIMGDDNIANMAPLDASIFNTDERVLLRVWFSDGVNGFQKLSPDRPITNPALIGLQDQKELTMYVNPITGNDRFPGNSPKKPKKTIQAAWNALPRLLSTTATIQLADGEYYESVLMQGKYVPGDCRIVLRGNPVSSSSVSILGSADRATSTTPSGGDIITINQQRNVRFESLRVAYAKSRCFRVSQGSSLEIDKCQLVDSNAVMNIQDQCWVTMTNSLVSDSPSSIFMTYGIFCQAAAFDADNCRFIHVQPRVAGGIYSTAVSAATTSRASLINCVVDGWNYGTVTIFNAVITFTRGESNGGNIVRNCNVGTHVLGSSAVQAANPGQGGITYQNCTKNVNIDSSSVG